MPLSFCRKHRQPKIDAERKETIEIREFKNSGYCVMFVFVYILLKRQLDSYTVLIQWEKGVFLDFAYRQQSLYQFLAGPHLASLCCSESFLLLVSTICPRFKSIG